MKTLHKILSFLIFSSLFWNKISIAAIYVPSDGINPGSLQFWNVQVDASSNVRATLTALDNASIYAGQVYELNLNQLDSPSGPQDAAYNSLSQQIVAQNVIQTLEEHFAVALHLTKLDLTTNVLEFTITELRSQTVGVDNQIVEQITTFVAGPKGDKGDIGPPGPPGPQGEKGDPGAFPAGNATGDIQYWDGKAWMVIPIVPVPAGIPPNLTICDGVPTWGPVIGSTGPAGGFVFHVSGCGGLEAAPIDQSSGAKWGCAGTNITGAEGTAVGTGAQNTTDILSGCADSGTAAEVADNYSLNGFNDWFLPSKDELDLMYTNLHLNGLGGFSNIDDYWSSSEFGNLLAWGHNFSIGQQGVDKGFTLRVRAVRAF